MKVLTNRHIITGTSLKKMLNPRVIIGIALMGLVLTLFTSSVSAGDIDLKTAIELGIKYNYELDQQRESIKELERNRDLLETQIDWHLGINNNVQYSDPVPRLLNDNEILNLTLEGGKTTIDGLKISSSLTLNSELSELDNLDDKYNFSLDLSKRLYPILPTETEKGFIQSDNQLIVAEASLEAAENSKEVDWLESYLSVVRLQEKLKYSKLSYELAEDNLAQVKAQLAIEEAGQDQMLMAEISLQEAQLQVEQLQNAIAQAEDRLALELGLSNENIDFQEDDSYLDKFINRANSIDITEIDKKVIDTIKENNVQLRRIMLNKDYKENELKWQLKEDGVKVDGFGKFSYSGMTDSDEWQVGVGVSYDFYDGGQQEVTVEGIKAKINNLDKEYSNTLQQQVLQLRSLLNQQKLNGMKLKSAETSLEKAKLEAKLYESQYKQGLISENQFKQKALAVKQAEVSLKETQDQLLISKLRIALLVGMY